MLQVDLLQSFEITKLQGAITRLQAGDQVFELRSSYGHEMLIASGVDLTQAGVKVGDNVQVDLLDGLVVDLKRSAHLRLSFQRQDVILTEDFGPMREGARVAMGTGTAEVMKISEKDQDLSLRGPFGGIHNLDIRDGIDSNPLQTLRLSDYVEFRAIQPIATAISKLNESDRLLGGEGTNHVSSGQHPDRPTLVVNYEQALSSTIVQLRRGLR